MKKNRSHLLFLKDILVSMNNIAQFINNMNLEEFKNDAKTTSAVLHELEVIGEATKQIPAEIRAENPDIPWSLMAKMRDKIIHWYYEIDHEIIWKVAKERIPEILPHIEKLSAQLKH